MPSIQKKNERNKLIINPDDRSFYLFPIQPDEIADNNPYEV